MSDEGGKKLSVLESQGYIVAQNLGHGSYATVKAAHSNKHKTHVAIKIISKKKAPQDFLDKFLPRELEIVKTMKHPSLICFLQSIETTNRVYLVMELASGGDLLEVIRKNGHVKEPQAGVWFNQLTEGISYCHKKGVVHRDLKCENVLLDKKNNLKITDFGFARNVETTSKAKDRTMSETYCGSYAYAPPEILKGIPYEPHLADIWSMGVILYTLVFGRLPFDDSNHRILLKQVQSAVEYPHSSDVSPECRTLISKLLTHRSKRLTLEQIMNETWYKKYPPGREEPPAATTK
ncbi:testis-specific serine/threonine-protein kinase 4-like [Lineus longissimus]|uniref:testis-specific serine/threonine-protein kinase 4-like n=1 Tax=Lineus longissimus TaxID=88925 RepID=UPI00315E02D6